MPFAKLFRNRWAALLWAGGILWTAYDVAESAPAPAPPANAARSAGANDDAPQDATGAPVSNADLETLAHFGGDGAN